MISGLRGEPAHLPSPLLLPIPVIQLLQVLTVALGAPGVTGVIARVEARLQGRRGPRIRQPYYDLAKLLRKEALAPEGASWFFLAAPLIAVTCYLTIPLLIPVLTSYGLPLGYMGDILGGGFLLSLASFVAAAAALETGSPYAQLGVAVSASAQQRARAFARGTVTPGSPPGSMSKASASWQPALVPRHSNSCPRYRRRTSTSSRPSDWMRFSAPYRAA
jgi:NADH dehydrogenase